jgi:predicted secreted protein
VPHHFKAIKEGEENIQLEFRRTFEKGILKSCKIKIEVL